MGGCGEQGRNDEGKELSSGIVFMRTVIIAVCMMRGGGYGRQGNKMKAGFKKWRRGMMDGRKLILEDRCYTNFSHHAPKNGKREKIITTAMSYS